MRFSDPHDPRARGGHSGLLHSHRGDKREGAERADGGDGAFQIKVWTHYYRKLRCQRKTQREYNPLYPPLEMAFTHVNPSPPYFSLT